MAERLIGKDGRPITGDVRMWQVKGIFFGGVIFAAGLGGFIIDELLDKAFGVDFELGCGVAVSLGGLLLGFSAIAMAVAPHKRPY